MIEGCPSVLVDIEILQNYLNIEIGDSFDKIKNLRSICKVKNHVGDNVFDPVIVSIGPYHREEKTLQAMKKLKWKCVGNILKINKKITLQDYIKSLREVEHITRSYYTEEIRMGSNEFVTMLLLDGVFILVFLCVIKFNHDSDGHIVEENPDIEVDALQFNFVVQDLLLIGNQIPFFALMIIYGLFIGEDNNAPSLSEIISYDMENILVKYPKSIKETNISRNVDHFLHLCHIYLKPSRNVDFYFTQYSDLLQGQKVNGWRSALEYHIAGVKFKKRESDEYNPHSLMDVRFINNVLEIPHLEIDETTTFIFKNLIALERTNPKFGNDVTAYIIFMSQLVKDGKDATLLVSKGIIEHDLRAEEEIVDIFMKLREGIIFDFAKNFYLRNICHNLEAYYRSRMKCWTAWFRQTASAMARRWLPIQTMLSFNIARRISGRS